MKKIIYFLIGIYVLIPAYFIVFEGYSSVYNWCLYSQEKQNKWKISRLNCIDIADKRQKENNWTGEETSAYRKHLQDSVDQKKPLEVFLPFPPLSLLELL